MGKRSRGNKKRKLQRIEKNKNLINRYIQEYPHFCKGKPLSLIIKDYKEVFKSETPFEKLYTPEELKSIILL